MTSGLEPQASSLRRPLRIVVVSAFRRTVPGDDSWPRCPYRLSLILRPCRAACGLTRRHAAILFGRGQAPPLQDHAGHADPPPAAAHDLIGPQASSLKPQASSLRRPLRIVVVSAFRRTVRRPMSLGCGVPASDPVACGVRRAPCGLVPPGGLRRAACAFRPCLAGSPELDRSGTRRAVGRAASLRGRKPASQRTGERGTLE
jgi:hypothetical protein